MAKIAIGKRTTHAELQVRAEVLQAPLMTSDKGEEFDPAYIAVTYTRTNQRPWIFSRVLVKSDVPLGPSVSLFSARRREVEALPQWVRDFIAQNTPGAP